MRIDTELELAINLLAKLNDNPRTSVELARELNATQDQVRKIGNRLSQADLCQSLRGACGGFYKHRQVRASEIVRCIQKERIAIARAADVQDALKFVLENTWI